jgi:enoyl-CoA hydratase/carnithine racemase
MILTGASIDAAEAFRIGLIDEVVALETLLERALEHADRIAAAAPLAVAYAKEAVLQGLDGSLAAGLQFEQDLAAFLESTSDRQEGASAFRERRRPAFRGQ